MKTDLDCVPCFLKQAWDAAAFAGADKATKKKILKALVQEIARFDFNLCPSEMGRILYGLVRKKTQTHDPFKKIKQKSNRLALKLYPRLKQKVQQSQDRLLTAVELAIAGNIIDYGMKNSLDISKELDKIFAEEDQVIREEDKALFDYPSFKKAIQKAKNILYLGDNAGETVFDRVLIEELKGKNVTYAVRGGPIINDCLREDALFCQIDKYARVISSGCNAPGTLLKFCTRKFHQVYHDAGLIISKGQGNFEALADEKRCIFFLFRAKCPVVAKHLKCKLGDIILKKAR